MSSASVGIRELRSRLSAYLRRIKAGETVLITDRGKPVGRIVPVEESREEALRRLEQSGALAWSGRKLSSHRRPLPEVRGDRMISDLLLEDRE